MLCDAHHNDYMNFDVTTLWRHFVVYLARNRGLAQQLLFQYSGILFSYKTRINLNGYTDDLLVQEVGAHHSTVA